MAAALGVASLCALAAGGVGLDADVSMALRATRVELTEALAAPLDPRTARSTGQIELVPRAALRADLGPRLALEYAPRLFLPVDLGEGAPELTDRDAFEGRGEVLHRGGLGVEEAFRSIRLGLRGDVTWGKTDLLQGAWSSDPVPAAGRIRILNARATATASTAPSRRTTISAEAGAFRTGGADAEARRVLPDQRGVLAGADLRWSASRRDALSAGVAATLARTADTDAAYARASVGWRRSTSRTTTLRAGAGLALSLTSPAGGEDVRGLAPWAEVGLESTGSGGRRTQGVSLRLEPALDAITGEVQQRVEARGSLSWKVGRDLALSAEGAAAAARFSASGFDLGTEGVVHRVASLATRAEQRVAAGTRLALGAWVRWQESAQPGVLSFREWGGLVELKVELPTR